MGPPRLPAGGTGRGPRRLPPGSLEAGGPDKPPMSRAKRCLPLRSLQAPLRFRNRRSRATSSERPRCLRLGSSLRPVGPASHPRTPSLAGSPSTKESHAPTKETEAGESVGLVQGHYVYQISPGKSIPLAASDWERKIHRVEPPTNPSPLLIPSAALWAGLGVKAVGIGRRSKQGPRVPFYLETLEIAGWRGLRLEVCLSRTFRMFPAWPLQPLGLLLTIPLVQVG